jgi:hypothetical protein
LRDLDLAELPHPLFAFLLLLEQMPLLDDFEVQQTEEAASVAEAEGRRRLRLSSYGHGFEMIVTFRFMIFPPCDVFHSLWE